MTNLWPRSWTVTLSATRAELLWNVGRRAGCCSWSPCATTSADPRPMTAANAATSFTTTSAPARCKGCSAATAGFQAQTSASRRLGQLAYVGMARREQPPTLVQALLPLHAAEVLL